MSAPIQLFGHVAAAALTLLAIASPTAANGVPGVDIKSCEAYMDGKLPSPLSQDFNFTGTIRNYYITAEEVEWDYAPTGWDNWLGVPMEQSPRAQRAGALQYGTKWLKALYRGYTSSDFTEQTEQPEWQGTQGPTIRSEVGDLIQIMFVNKLSKNYATLHSMGLGYTKFSEGANYPDDVTPGVNETLVPIEGGVAPGGCVVYKWEVNTAAGPNNGEPARTHSYHSYVDMQTDTNAGLIGPHIVYAPGMMKSTMKKYREYTLLFMIYQEAESWLSGQNAATLNGPNATPLQGGAPAGVGFSGSQWAVGPDVLNASTPYYNNYTIWHPQLVNLEDANGFPEAPAFFTMNGYIFSNNPVFDSCLGDDTIWYVNAYGSASHVFHLHGNGFSRQGPNEAANSVNDGVAKTFYMSADNPGLWQVICHVNIHQSFGMVANYNVHYGGQCPGSM